MPNKNLCNKCGQRYFPPTGKKSEHAKKGQSSSDNNSHVMLATGVPVEVTSNNNDTLFMPQGDSPVSKGKK